MTHRKPGRKPRTSRDPLADGIGRRQLEPQDSYPLVGTVYCADCLDLGGVDMRLVEGRYHMSPLGRFSDKHMGHRLSLKGLPEDGHYFEGREETS